MNLTVFNHDFRDACVSQYKMIFADPPDNIGLKYDGFEDQMKDHEYRDLLWHTIAKYEQCDVFWMSFNVNHIQLVSSILNSMETHLEDYSVRWLMQYTTFGYYMADDFGRCFRPLLRIMRKGAEVYPNAIRIESDRQKMGDKRADPRGKIPGDVWQFNRVTGNSKQRRKWHNTQLNEELYERCLSYSASDGDRVADLFAGTGTMARAVRNLGMDLNVDLFDVSTMYCTHIAAEHSVGVIR
jgi:site-specific DNA-methyltransferase (adenine-specific)